MKFTKMVNQTGTYRVAVIALGRFSAKISCTFVTFRSRWCISVAFTTVVLVEVAFVSLVGTVICIFFGESWVSSHIMMQQVSRANETTVAIISYFMK